MTMQEFFDFVTSKGFISTWATVIGTFLGAGLGALAAFKLEGKRREAEEETRHLAAANHALYVVFQYWNFLRLYKERFIDPNKEDNLVRLFNPAITITPTPTDKLNQTELQFILQTDRADLYLKLMISEMNFNTAMKLIENQRNLLAGTDLSKFFFTPSDMAAQAGEKELIQMFGAHVVHQAKDINEEIIKSIEKQFKELKEFFPKLREGIIQILPSNDRLISVSFEPAKPISQLGRSD